MPAIYNFHSVLTINPAGAALTTACNCLVQDSRNSNSCVTSLNPAICTATVACCAALKRKGKGDDVSEQQMDAVVRAHNGERSFWGSSTVTHVCPRLAEACQTEANIRDGGCNPQSSTQYEHK
jgi:hypothetical protein